MSILEQLQPHISLDRVKKIDVVREFVECYLCHGLLWYPVACENCEKTFCSACIQALNAAEPEQISLHGCSKYIERQNPPTTIRLLANLKINCCYTLNGCTEILSYNELKNHEDMCDYQLLSCDGCLQEIIKQNFDKHQSECQLASIMCDQCLTSYKRKDKDSHKVQLIQSLSKIFIFFLFIPIRIALVTLITNITLFFRFDKVVPEKNAKY
jgi:hypothetical protein